MSKAVNVLWHQSLKLVQNNQSEGSVISDDKCLLVCFCILPKNTKTLAQRFFFCQHANISDTSQPISIILGQKNKYPDANLSHDPLGVRGHDGVTGFKKVIFTKKASSPSYYIALTRDLCICISLTPSTKVMGLKKYPGSLGVTGVKS